MDASDRRSVVDGSHREALPDSRRGAPADPDEEIDVTVVLRRPSASPAPTAAGTVLSREEFATAHGADPDDVALVRDFAARHDLQVASVDASARTMHLRGTVADLQDAFEVSLYRYEHASGSYRGREGSLTVPPQLEGIVVAVLGLDDRPQARAHFRRHAGAARQLPATSFVAPEVAALYDFPTDVNGAGECVGIIELGGGYRKSDLTSYFRGLQIAPPTVVSVRVDGAKNAPGTAAQPDPADGEVALDIQVAGAVAPGARYAVYFAPNTDQGFLDAINAAVHDTTNKPSVISISWGGPEDTWTSQARSAIDNACTDAGSVGVTVLAAAGDHGSADQPPLGSDSQKNPAYDGRAHVDFPASSPHVLACGGTRLQGQGSSISSEVVWNSQDGWATGGGVSDVFAPPSWQQGVGVPPSVNAGAPSGRGVPDVAGNADSATGYQVTLYGQTQVIGGTSAVAPLWAGLTALLDEALGAPLGSMSSRLYATSARAAFRDITSGTNAIPAVGGQVATPGYKAAAGWDACSGLGSPDGTALQRILATPPSTGS